jgi:hypothetical protein
MSANDPLGDIINIYWPRQVAIEAPRASFGNTSLVVTIGPPIGLCYSLPFTCQGGIMRAPVYAIVAAIGLAAHPAFAQADRSAAPFWKTVQATCDATAAKPPSELSRRIAQTAIDEFTRFGGHQIDSNGRLFRFGLTEAEHEEDDGGDRPVSVGHLGWWQVMKYWRALYGGDSADKLEVRGYRDASTLTQETQGAEVLRTEAAQLLRAADGVSDPEVREILREAALRAAIIDTPWSAAFISYVIRQSGVAANAFQFSNAHRAYIYDAFAASAAELTNEAGDRLYRACPVTTTRPRAGDLICQLREPALADASDEAVRERIRAELGGSIDARSVRRTHCEVVAHIDARARKMYTIGGNVNQAVTARKLNLRRDLKFSAAQKGHCGGSGEWTMPQSSALPPHAPSLADKCSLNDKKWFVLLQLR